MDDIIDDLLRVTPENEYMDEDLFDLQLHCYSDVREYMRRRFYGSVSDWNLGSRRGGMTRRSRKVWDRLEAAVNRVRSTGSEGVYLVYDGWNLKGWPVKTIVRGTTVVEDFEVIGKPGFGKFISRTS